MTDAMQLVRRFAARWRLTEDELHDAISHAWEFARRGRGSPGSIAWYAIKRVRSARRFDGSSRSVDHPRHRAGHARRDQDCELIGSTLGNPARIAGFRIDFESWRERLPDRLRAAVDLLASGETTQEAARQLGVSPARVSQLRKELADSWYEHLTD